MQSDDVAPMIGAAMRAGINFIEHRVFGSYDEIVDHCCDAWNKLVEQPWRIMSLGLRAWARGF